MRSHAVLLMLLAASPALAQAPATSATTDARDHWRMMSGYVLRVATDLPESKYGYKPTKEVRSFGELFSHVAGAQSMFCAIALGEKPPAEDAVKATTKADLVAALKASNADCERAYAQGDSAAAGMVNLFGERHTRLYTLIMNATHDAEHYGNLVTYLRLNGMVPPSSQPQSRP